MGTTGISCAPFFSPLGVVFTKGFASASASSFFFSLTFFSPAAPTAALAAMLAAFAAAFASFSSFLAFFFSALT